MSRKIFISYSHQDNICARGIARFLSRQGYDVWIDVENLEMGQKWASNIDDAIKECDTFIALVSKNSARRPEVLREIAEALDRSESEDDFYVLFVVIGSVHSTWFVDENGIGARVLNYLRETQFIQFDAKGTISIAQMQNLLRAVNGKIVYNVENDISKGSDYIYEAGIPEKVYDNESENYFYRVHVSDLAPSTVFPFGLDNQWLPDEVMEAGSDLRSQFLQNGFKSDKVQEFLYIFQTRTLFLALIHSRQIILNRASILNSQSLQKFYSPAEDGNRETNEAFESLLRDGSIVVFLYGNHEMMPFVSKLPDYSTTKTAVERWNELCSRIPLYCIRENWETPIDRHKEEFVKQCTTFAFNSETNDMLAECFGFDSVQKEEFLTVLKEIEMTVFLQTHIMGTGRRAKVEGYSRSGFYKNFIVKDKSTDCPEPVLDCVFDENKPFYEQLKKIIDVYYNSIFTNYFNCAPMIPNVKPEDTYIHQLYLKHGIKEVGTDELEYAFSEFLKNETVLNAISELGDDFYIDNWTLEKIVAYRNSIRWREYVELLEYLTNRATTWEIDFSEVENLVGLFVSSIKDIKAQSVTAGKTSGFVPAYTFRLCIGSKVLDIICSKEVKKLKKYPGIFFEKRQNSMSIQFFIGDTTSKKNNVNDSVFFPVKIFDGKTNYMGGNAYFEEICSFLIEQCGFMWMS